MGKIKSFKKLGLFAAGIILLAAQGCSETPTDVNNSSDVGYSTIGKANVSVFLTDAPLHNVESVFVNVKQMELLLSKGGKQGRLIIGQDIGIIDLLLLRDGVLLPVANLDMPLGVSVKQIRLTLHNEGNSVLRTDDTSCNLQTPSAQHTGIKIIIPGSGIIFEGGYDYNLVVDFDAEKSIVLKGNGGCLLKPVLKLETANRLPNGTNPDNGSDPNQEAEPDDLLDGEQPWNVEDLLNDGFDMSDPSTWPPGFTEEDLWIFF